MLHAVPLQSLLDWLSQPKSPNLVEASAAAAPDRALVLAVTKQMLYGEETPLLGVGLMYKPHYIFTKPFSAGKGLGCAVRHPESLRPSHLLLQTYQADVAMQLLRGSWHGPKPSHPWCLQMRHRVHNPLWEAAKLLPPPEVMG